MRADIVRQLTVAVAVSVPQDEAAFEMLQLDYIEEFMRYYNQKVHAARTEGQAVPAVLDEMINFAIKELPIRQPNCQSLSDLLTDKKKVEIRRRFIEESIEHMLTSLAKRDQIRDSIRQFLHIKDKRNTHAVIDATRLEPVVTGFLTMFEESSAASFQFTGTFLEYVMHCFSHFYYPSHKKDIWQNLTSVDFAKREAETNMTAVTMLTPRRDDDLLIHDLLINISEVNDLMFNHSGQSEDARGVSYDIFYMLIYHLCQKKVDALNSRLRGKPDGVNSQVKGFQLQLIDERDRKETRNGLVENKGIANKISNARMLIPILFDMVQRGEWTLDNLTEVRDTCFGLGKKDRDGKNCVWRDVQLKAETSRYFDMKDTAHNFKAFEKIFKGVLSAYALMNAFEERGMYIVDTYKRNPRLFEDKRIPRSVDYLSALEHVDLILKMQEDGDTPAALNSSNHGELLRFEDMVREYAGSEQNNHANIRDNRAHAFSRGLLGPNTRLKQAGEFQTPFEQLQSAADYMTAVPRGFEEYVLMLAKENRLPAHFAPEVILAPSDVVKGKYNSLYNNKFMTENPDIAEYYLYRVAKGEEQLSSYEWHIGNSLLPSLAYRRVAQNEQGQPYISEMYCLYISLIDAFLLINPIESDDGSSPMLLCRNLNQLQLEVNDSFFNGRRNAELEMQFQSIPSHAFNPFIRMNFRDGDAREVALDKSMGFDTFLGIENYGTPDVQNRLKSIKVYPKYRSSVERYISWMSDISRVQYSYVELMQTMLSFGIFMSRCSLSGITGRDQTEGAKLVSSLIRSEFTESNLAWFFSHLEECNISKLLKVDMRWNTVNTSVVEFTGLDLSVLDILYDRGGEQYQKGTLMYELYTSLRDYETAPQRFVQLYNFISTKLSFIRVLRDAYDLVFNVVATGLSTFGCELNSRFDIESTMTSGKDNVGAGGMLDSKYALIDTIPVENTMRYVGLARQSNWKNFSVLCDDLLDYFSQCRLDISQLVDYDVSASSSMQSKFKEWGSAFYAIPTYNHPIVMDCLKDIRAKSRVDDSGFLMAHTSYFKGHCGDSEYYVHISGRMVEISPNYTGPASFDFNNEDDRKKYEAIIRDGRGHHAW